MNEIKNRLEQVRQSYIASLADRAAEIRQLWEAIKTNDFQANSLADQQSLYNIVHKIGGSGATFGFDELSETARPLELLLNKISDNPFADNDDITQLNTLILELVETCDRIRKRDND